MYMYLKTSLCKIDECFTCTKMFPFNPIKTYKIWVLYFTCIYTYVIKNIYIYTPGFSCHIYITSLQFFFFILSKVEIWRITHILFITSEYLFLFIKAIRCIFNYSSMTSTFLHIIFQHIMFFQIICSLKLQSILYN